MNRQRHTHETHSNSTSSVVDAPVWERADSESDHDGDPDHGGHGGHGGHDDHGDHAEMFRRLFWRNLVLAIPVIAFSDMVQDWFGYTLEFPGSSWIPPVLGTIIYLDGGRPFLTGGVDEARSRQPGMMLLIAMAITVAFVASLVSLTDLLDLEFWWELAALVVIMLLGHWQEMKAIGQAQGCAGRPGRAPARRTPSASTDDRRHRGRGPGFGDSRSQATVVLVRPGGSGAGRWGDHLDGVMPRSTSR